jgi:hypothetical protein
MNVHLDSSFPSDTREDLKAVARDVLEVVRLRMGKEAPVKMPIVCYVRPAGPMTSVASDERTLRVGLSVTRRDYARLAYQLGHELAHVMMDPRRTNGLIEVVAVAMSLQTLDDIGKRWQHQAPYPEWRPYAKSFPEYRALVEEAALSRMPNEVTDAARCANWGHVARYLASKRRELLQDIEQRDLQHLAAMLLRTNEVPWKQFWGLSALTDPPPWRDKRYRDDLPLDPRRVPECLRRIGV